MDVRKLKLRLKQAEENGEFLEYHISYYAKLHADWVRQVMFLEMAQGEFSPDTVIFFDFIKK